MATPSADPREIFISAEDHFRGYHCLLRETTNLGRHAAQKGIPLVVPANKKFFKSSILLAAFSLELFLKGILAAQSAGKFPKGHDLQHLFNQLSEFDRLSIEHIYDHPPPDILLHREAARSRGVPTEFETALKASAEAFQGLRYDFEKNSTHKPDWVAGDILIATRIHSFDRYPGLLAGLDARVRGD